MSKKLPKRQIIEILPANKERERKYVSSVPREVSQKGEAAIAKYKKQRLLEIYEYVRTNIDEFVTADHPAISPYLPPGIKEVFDMPAERTRPRQRVYYADVDLKVQKQQAEFRQELKSYGVKQTIKRGDEATDEDPTLDRDELPSKLSYGGINLRAADGKGNRKWLTDAFNQNDLKPGFRMVSQRLRTTYHPEGNQDVLIELACDVILIGETIFGRVWQDPKLEIEIKQPENLGKREAQRILDKEERRLAKFGLRRQLESNAVMGYEMLKPDLKTDEGKEFYKKLNPDTVWWTTRTRRKFGLS